MGERLDYLPLTEDMFHRLDSLDGADLRDVLSVLRRHYLGIEGGPWFVDLGDEAREVCNEIERSVDDFLYGRPL